MVDALIEFSNRIREDRRRQAEHVGNTATIKLLVPVVTCLAPPVFILLIGPAVLDLREFITRERGVEQSSIRDANQAPRPVILEEGNSRRRQIGPRVKTAVRSYPPLPGRRSKAAMGSLHQVQSECIDNLLCGACLAQTRMSAVLQG